MIILGVKNSESEIEHDRVLCVLRNVLGMLGLLTAQCNRWGLLRALLFWGGRGSLETAREPRNISLGLFSFCLFLAQDFLLLL